MVHCPLPCPSPCLPPSIPPGQPSGACWEPARGQPPARRRRCSRPRINVPLPFISAAWTQPSTVKPASACLLACCLPAQLALTIACLPGLASVRCILACGVDCLPVTCSLCARFSPLSWGLDGRWPRKGPLPVSTCTPPGRSRGPHEIRLGSSPGGAVPFYRWGAGGCKVKYVFSRLLSDPLVMADSVRPP